jgi:hypothetical protein
VQWATIRFIAAAAVFAVLLSSEAEAAKGDFLQTDTLGMSLVTRDMTLGRTRTVSDATNLSQLVGLHYFFADRFRAGMSFQITERLWPEPVGEQSRLQRLALLPQVGWRFYDPFFAALILSYAPRTDGQANPALAIQPAIGAAIPVADRLNVSLALEVPYTFYPRQVLGLTSLVGVSFLF